MLSISPRGDPHNLNGEMYLSLATVQTMPCPPRRPLGHGGQETKLQLDRGQRRWATTSQAQPTISYQRLLLSLSLIRRMRTSTV